MLGKLIKYDFKATSRNMFPLFIAMIALTAICSLMVRMRLTSGFIFTSLVIILGILLSCSFIITIFCTVNRFVNGLLKNEGYLSFALPVDTLTHILSKVINTIIWAFLELICVGICILIMGAIAGSVEELRMAFKAILEMDIDVWHFMIEALVLMTLELIAATCLFFAAFAVAHLFGKHQTMIATLFVILVMIIRTYFFPSRVYISEFTDFLSLDLWWYIKPLIFTAIYSAITWFILDRRLNLE